MKVVAMVNRSTGNESVGDMWVDVYEFNPTDTLMDVLMVADKHNAVNGYEIRTTITLQVLQEGKK